MKKITPLLVLLFILFPSYGSGEPAQSPIIPKDTVELPDTQEATVDAFEENEKILIEQKVRNQPSKHAKTVDLYISKMAAIPGASDLGWQVHRVENGYEVVREIQKGLKVFSFAWKFADSGEITPINKRAEDITKKLDSASEKPTN